MATRHALFRFDAGLLFVAAGLALCASAVLLPAQRDLHTLQQQLSELRLHDELMQARLRVTAEVIHELDRGNADLRRRLVSSQLNLAPAGDTPIMLVTSRQPEISEWISARAHVDPYPVSAHESRPDTALDRLVNGPYRLWILGGSVLCVFIGLMQSTGTITRQRTESTVDDARGDTRLADNDSHTKPGAISDHPFRSGGDEEVHVLDEVGSGNDAAWCEIDTFPARHVGSPCAGSESPTAGAPAARPTASGEEKLPFPKSLFDFDQ